MKSTNRRNFIILGFVIVISWFILICYWLASEIPWPEATPGELNGTFEAVDDSGCRYLLTLNTHDYTQIVTCNDQDKKIAKGVWRIDKRNPLGIPSQTVVLENGFFEGPEPDQHGSRLGRGRVLLRVRRSLGQIILSTHAETNAFDYHRK